MYKDHLINVIERSNLEESGELLSIVESTNSIDELEAVESYVTESVDEFKNFEDINNEVMEIKRKLRKAQVDKDLQGMQTQISRLKEIVKELRSDLRELRAEYGDGKLSKSTRSIASIISALAILYSGADIEPVKASAAKAVAMVSAATAFAATLAGKSHEAKYKEASGATYKELTGLLDTIEIFIMRAENDARKLGRISKTAENNSNDSTTTSDN